jgi:hypothetical protein
VDLLVLVLTPHLEGEAKVESWWRHVRPLQHLPISVDLVVGGSADVARLAGSRWHVISEAARQGVVLVVQPWRPRRMPVYSWRWWTAICGPCG